MRTGLCVGGALLLVAVAGAAGSVLYSIGRRGEPSTFGYALSLGGGPAEPLWTTHQLVEVSDVAVLGGGRNTTLYRDRVLGAVFSTAAGYKNGKNATEKLFAVPPAPPLGVNSTAAAEKGMAVHEASSSVFVAVGDTVLFRSALGGKGEWKDARMRLDGIVDPRVSLATAGDHVFATYLVLCGGSFCDPAAVCTAVVRQNATDPGAAPATTFYRSSQCGVTPNRAGDTAGLAVCVGGGSLSGSVLALCDVSGVGWIPSSPPPDGGQPIFTALSVGPFDFHAFWITGAAVSFGGDRLAFVRPASTSEPGKSVMLNGGLNTTCPNDPTECAYKDRSLPIFAQDVACSVPANGAFFEATYTVGGFSDQSTRFVTFPRRGEMQLARDADGPPWTVLVDLLAHRPTVVAAGGGRLWAADNTTGGLTSVALPSRAGKGVVPVMGTPFAPTRLDDAYSGTPACLSHDSRAGLVYFDRVPEGDPFLRESEYHLLVAPSPDRPPAPGANATVSAFLNGSSSASSVDPFVRPQLDASGTHIYYLSSRGEVMRAPLGGDAPPEVCARPWCCGTFLYPPQLSPLDGFYLDGDRLMIVAAGQFLCAGGLNPCPRTVLLQAPANCSAPDPVFAYPGATTGAYDHGLGFYEPIGGAGLAAAPGNASGAFYAVYGSERPWSVGFFRVSPPSRRTLAQLDASVWDLEATGAEGGRVYLSAAGRGTLLSCNATAQECETVRLAPAVRPRVFVRSAAGSIVYYDSAYGAILAVDDDGGGGVAAPRVVAELGPAVGLPTDELGASPVRAMAVNASGATLLYTVGLTGTSSLPAGLYSAPLRGAREAPRLLVAASDANNITDVGGVALLADGTTALLGVTLATDRFGSTEGALLRVSLDTGEVLAREPLQGVEGHRAVGLPYEVALPPDTPYAPLLLVAVHGSYGQEFLALACSGAGGMPCGNTTAAAPTTQGGSGNSLYQNGACKRGLSAGTSGTFWYVEGCEFSEWGGVSLFRGNRSSGAAAAERVALLYPNPPSFVSEGAFSTYGAQLVDDGQTLLVSDDDTVVSFSLGALAVAPAASPVPSVASSRRPAVPAFDVRGLSSAAGNGTLAFTAAAGMTHAWSPRWSGSVREGDIAAAGGGAFVPFARRPLASGGRAPARLFAAPNGTAAATDWARLSVEVVAAGASATTTAAAQPVVRPTASPGGGVLDPSRGEIVFVDDGARAIKRASYAGSAAYGDLAFVVEAASAEHSEWNTTAIALDPTRHELYFTSRNQSAVFVVVLPADPRQQPAVAPRLVLSAPDAALAVPERGTFASLAFDADADALVAVVGDQFARPDGNRTTVVVWKRAAFSASLMHVPGPPAGVVPANA